MQPQSRDAPPLTIELSQATADGSPSQLDAVAADLALLGGGRLRARAGDRVVRFALPDAPSHAELLHPYLAPAAALMWQWAGEEALHAGAFELDAGAVLLFGTKESGKSTQLAWLAREQGLTVLADDLAVIDEGRVLAGPRSIDLRGPVASGGVAVRSGERVRVSLPPAPTSSPVACSVLLEWGPELKLSRVPPARRLEVLAGQRTYPPLLGRPGALLDLAARPMFTLARPARLDSLEATTAALLVCCSEP